MSLQLENGNEFGDENFHDASDDPFSPFPPAPSILTQIDHNSITNNYARVVQWGMHKGTYDTRHFRCYRDDCRRALPGKCNFHNYLPYVPLPLGRNMVTSLIECNTPDVNSRTPENEQSEGEATMERTTQDFESQLSSLLCDLLDQIDHGRKRLRTRIHIGRERLEVTYKKVSTIIDETSV